MMTFPSAPGFPLIAASLLRPAIGPSPQFTAVRLTLFLQTWILMQNQAPSSSRRLISTDGFAGGRSRAHAEGPRGTLVAD